MITGLQEMKDRILPDHLDDLQNVGGKVGHQHYRHITEYRTYFYKNMKRKKKK
jgi:hypothetical protein